MKKLKRVGNNTSKHHPNKKIITEKRGDGIVDKIIDKVPFEMHVPGYQYCGPGKELV